MRNFKLKFLYGYFLALLPFLCNAASDKITSPEAPSRTFIQNYKDMVLAHCIADAYQDDEIASMDAGSSVTALREWTYYDMNESIITEVQIVDSYLSRNYLNPSAEIKIKDIKFDFLKCLDLYHSKELDTLAKRVIEHPQETFRSTVRNYYRDLNRKK
jgi:hypothetical protein